MWYHPLYCFSFPLLCSSCSVTILFTVSYMCNILSMSNQSNWKSNTLVLYTFLLSSAPSIYLNLTLFLKYQHYSNFPLTIYQRAETLLRMEALLCSITGINHYWRFIILHFIVKSPNFALFPGSDLCLLSLAFIHYIPTSHTPYSAFL